MRVFVAGTSFLPSYGGPAFSVSALAVALEKEGADVTLWAPDGSAVEAVSLKHSRVRCLGKSPHAALSNPDKYDVIHDNGIWPLYHHRLARHSTQQSVPRIVSTRGMLEPWALRHRSWRKRLAWNLYQRADLNAAVGIHATSSLEAQNLARLELRAPVHVIPNGVDIPVLREAGRTAHGSTMEALFLGRLHPIKGLDMLIDAWARVRPCGWKLKICGNDEAGLRSTLEQAVCKAGLTDQISFVGAVDPGSRESLYSASHLVILPSHSENFGLVVAEALAHQVPVLTTTGTPWSDLPTSGCGWCVAPSVDMISVALREATGLSQLELKTMGRRGREMVESYYSWPSVAKKMIILYKNITSHVSKQGP